MEANVEIRPATAADAEAIVAVHFAAVHHTAAAFYPSDVLDRWSRQPDERRYEQVRRAVAKGEELLVVARDSSGVVGFGSIVPSLQELHGVYVHPRAGRRGIGALILVELERLAIERGVLRLQIEASVNAEAFYQRRGYQIVERSVFPLGGGIEMASVKMMKDLA